MKNKIVKEKVEKILYDVDWKGTENNRKRYVNKIDKLYRKEMLKEINALVEVRPVVSLEGQKMVELSWHNYLNLRDRLANANKTKVLKKMPKEYWSYTCCNIEVSEPKGTEVMCRSCGEWCSTK